MAEEQPSRIRGAIVPVTPFQQNCSIIWDEATNEGMVVDPGGDVDRILEALAQTEVKVRRILLTHGHLDHAGGAMILRSALPSLPDGKTVPIEGPDQRDQFLLEGIEKQAADYGFLAKNVTPDRFLSEGDTLTLGTHHFDIYHCPGHSPGSLVYVDAVSRFALVGDVLFQGSIGRFDFSYGDQVALVQSIKTKLLPLGDDIGFLCGHGPGSKFGIERMHNPYLR